MRAIFRIARAELEILFYSPIAWIMLILFTIQASFLFFMFLETNILINILNGKLIDFLTFKLFAGPNGVFTAIIFYVYLFIPLLTMGLISKEYSSGSIKLLYSSPLSNIQIVLGKYLAVLVYCLAIILILSIFVIFCIAKVENPDIPLLITGLFGIFLLMASYCAIGLFLSSLTNYQIVAALGTFGVITFLQTTRLFFQDVEVMREITYWLAIDGRAEEFISGMICSEDILYFFVITGLFISLTAMRLQVKRQKLKFSSTWSKYTLIIACAVILGYFSSRPALMIFYDVTATKIRTLTPKSQEIIKKLDSNLTMTNFSNLFDSRFMFSSPRNIQSDIKRYKTYWRFKPEIKFKYVFYYDDHGIQNLKNKYPTFSLEERMLKSAEINRVNPKLFKTSEEIQSIIDIESEEYGIVKLLETSDGKKTFLRTFNDSEFFPAEKEITAALKHLVMELPIVGFVNNRGTRSIEKDGDRDYSIFVQRKSYRHSLINNGFNIMNINIQNEIPNDINILVIADLRDALSEQENIHLNNYIQRGGNLLLLGEPGKQDILNPIIEQFGVSFVPGIIVTDRNINQQANVLYLESTEESKELSFYFAKLNKSSFLATFQGAVGIENLPNKDYKLTPLFQTPSKGYWNELQTTDFIDETAQYNPMLGEEEQTYNIMVALSRQINNKEQKIIISGDADCLSNGGLTLRSDNPKTFIDNFTIINGLFYWLSDYEVPIDTRRPVAPDRDIHLDMPTSTMWKNIFTYGISSIFLISFLLIWIRRRGR